MKQASVVGGFWCPECRGFRLGVEGTKRPAPGLVVRYRVCSACGYKLVTEERPRKAARPPAGK